MKYSKKAQSDLEKTMFGCQDGSNCGEMAAMDTADKIVLQNFRSLKSKIFSLHGCCFVHIV
jgi:hypothetical protein